MHTIADPIAPMPEGTAPGSSATPIAIVGLACRFPDADDPLALFESALAGRRAFRRLPPGRLGAVADSHDGRDGGRPGSGGSVPRAALIEGWQFDRAGFGIAEHAYLAADPAHWLALETAGRALADAGFPGGQGLARDRAGVIIGNTLTGEVSRAAGLRTRWPFVRAVLTTALAAGDVPPADRARALGQATAAFAAVPEMSGESLAGSQSGAIADRICRHFGLRGGGQAVDTAHSSSLLAVASAAALLAAGELDFVLAGGVDISLDPFELGALAQTGVLASGAMRIYDASPTGFLPGEGCGMLALMRLADARAADMPVYAEIVGWGVSSAGLPDAAGADPDIQLLALQRAYHRAGVDPADIQLIEGDGRGTADGDLAELTALTLIRAGAQAAAVLGSVKANIGHTKAAAGAAGLIKAALAVNAGVLPPVTGCARPHPMLTDEDAVLRVPRSAESWPPGTRLAAVSSLDPAGSHVHVVLRREPNQAAFPQSGSTSPHLAQARPGPAQHAAGPARPTGQSQSGTRALGSWTVPGAPRPEIFAISGPDRETVAAQLAAVARAATGLSDSELGDLACQLGRQASRGPVRVAIVTASQDELARLSREAVELLPRLRTGQLTARPGLFAADGATGQVVLLFPGEASTTAAGQDWPGPGSQPAIVQASLSALRWLDTLGVRATAALGHGVGEITGLVWAGSLAESDAAALVAQRAAVLAAPGTRRTAMICLAAGADAALALQPGGELVIAAYHGPRCHVLAGPADAVHDVARRAADAGIQAYVLDVPHALHSPAMEDRVTPLRGVLARVRFAAPRRRLISTVTGREVTSADSFPDLLGDQLVSPVRFAEALAEADAAADLLVDTGPGQAMAALAAGCSTVPAVSLAAGPGGPAAPDAAAALFAAGAVTSLTPLLAGRPSRPIDLAREHTFITNPYALATAELAALGEPAAGASPAGAAILARAAGLAGAADPPATADLPGTGRHDPAGAAGPAQTQHGPQDAAEFPGVGPWVRCFTEELRAPGSPVLPVEEEPWQLHATTRQPFGRMAAEAFEDDPAATGVLAVIGDLADPDAAATLVTAAQEAVAAGTLVVITPAAGLAGFCASLHAEHPTLGITLIRTANSMAGLLAAQRFAAAEAGQFRELVLDTRGEPREPVMVAAPRRPIDDQDAEHSLAGKAGEAGKAGKVGDPDTSDPGSSDPGSSDPEAINPDASGRKASESEDGERGDAGEPEPAKDPSPGGPAPGSLGPADVVLISGGGTRDLLAAARVLAGCGARLVLAGTAGPGEGAAIDVGLAVLRGAGADVSYVPADLSDPDEAETAIASVEQRVGPVTAVVHAASTGPLRKCLALSGDELGAQIARQSDGLSNVLGAVSAAGLRVLVTVGTAPARYGAAGHCAPALAASALAEQARRLKPSLPGCRILHADGAWPGRSDQARVAELAGPGPLGMDDTAAAEVSPAAAGPARRGRHAGPGGDTWPPGTGIRASKSGPARGDPRPVPAVGTGVLPGRGTGRRHGDLPPDRPVPGRSPHRRPHGAAAGRRAGGDGRGSVGASRAAAAAGRRDPDGRARGPAARRPGNHPADLRAAPRRRGGDRAALRGQRLPGRSFPGPVPARACAGARAGARRPGRRGAAGAARRAAGRVRTRADGGLRGRDRGRHRPVRAGVLPGRAVPPGRVPARGDLAVLLGAGPRGRRPAVVCRLSAQRPRRRGRAAGAGQPGTERRGHAHAAGLCPASPDAPGRVRRAHRLRRGGPRGGAGPGRAGRRPGRGLGGDRGRRGRAHRAGRVRVAAAGRGAARGGRALASHPARGRAGRLGGGVRPRPGAPDHGELRPARAGPAAPGGRRAVAGRGRRAGPAGRLPADRPGEHAGGVLLGSGYGWPGGQPARTGGTAPRGQCRRPHRPQQ